MTIKTTAGKFPLLLILTLAVLTFTGQPVRAQQLYFSALTVNEGLSQNAVLAIAQDSDGFIWLGTQNGLNRFDAHSFKIFKHADTDPHSISSNYITQLFKDKSGRLWVGTRDGLNLYCSDREDFLTIPLQVTGGDSTQLSKDYSLIISSIMQDQEDRIWVWTSQGLFMMEKTSKDSKLQPSYQSMHIPLPATVPGLGGTNARTIYQSVNGDFYLGSSAGLHRMRYVNDRLIPLPLPVDTEAGSVHSSYITTIYQDRQRRIWVGTLHDGIFVQDSPGTPFRAYPMEHPELLPLHKNIRKIIERPDGKILAGTLGGLCILDPVRGTCELATHSPQDPHSLSNNSIYSIYQAQDGVLWVGTYWGGVNYASPYTSSFNVYKTNNNSVLNSNIVSAIQEDSRHNLWIGTEGAGLTYLNVQTGQTTTYNNHASDPNSLASNLIKVIYIDADQTLWVGTHGGGLNRLHQGGFIHYLYNPNDVSTLNTEIPSLYKDPSSRLWVGTQQGLKIFKVNGLQLTALPNVLSRTLDGSVIKTIYKTKSGLLLLGTDHGLYVASDSLQLVAHLSPKDGLPAADVNCIYEDDLGRIWVGFYNAGFSQLELNSQDKRTQLSVVGSYSTRNGLSDNNVMAILSDHNQKLWISTGNGLSKFDPEQSVFSNYYIKDGIAGNTFNINAAATTHTGEILFGGYNGITRFYDYNIVHNQYRPKTVFTGLSILNKPVTIQTATTDENSNDRRKRSVLTHSINRQQELVFKADQSAFTINFATLNYSMPEKNRYAYRLLGFDKDWVYTNTPAATYMNLPAGHYTLKVKGTNNDQLWGPENSLDIVVKPHFYATVWAYLLYAAVFFSLLFFILRYFILQSLMKKDQELTQLKLNFFTNISHEIRTHLTLVNGPVDQLLQTVKDDTQTRQLHTIKKNTDSLLELVTELMDFRKAETGTLKLHCKTYDIFTFLEQDILEPFHGLSLAKNIQIQLQGAPRPCYADFDREQLHKVFFNLLHNAFKFSEPGGYINIVLQEGKEKEDLQIIITDNGKGIASDHLDNIFTNYYQGIDNGDTNTGYGIGLALAKRIVELHRGTITVTSQTDPARERRTTFTVTLPKRQPATSAAPHSPKTGAEHLLPEPAGKAPTHSTLGANQPTTVQNSPAVARQAPATTDPSLFGQRNSKEPYTLLIVEDNPELRAFIRSTLEKSYRVHEASNGQQGLQTALSLVPDIIISDIMMPVMDGIALSGEIKNHPTTSHIPLILLTAKSTTGDYITGLKTGADIYITKPFNTEVLLLHIHNLLALRTRTQQRLRAKLQLEPAPPTVGVISSALRAQPPDKEDQKADITEPVPGGQRLPELPPFVEDPFLKEMVTTIEQNIDNPALSVPFLARTAAMSQPVLYKKIHALTGLTVGELITTLRLKKAAELLRSGHHNVSETAFLTGFSDRRYFTKSFKKHFGIPPSELCNNKTK